MSRYIANYRDRDLNAFDVCRVKRLITEAVEIALTLCNVYLTRVGPAKIFDIINQIFPTAYVLNTSYWIYYSSEQGHCLCVCSKYGLTCRHTVNFRHWIDLTPVQEDDYKCIFVPRDSFIVPANFYCDVQVSFQTYDIMVRFDLQQEEEMGAINGDSKEVCIQARYCLAHELYAFPEMCVIFRPNPNSMPRYGQLIPNLLQRHVNSHECLTSNNVPRFTFVLMTANVPVHAMHRGPTTVAIPVNCDVFTDRVFLYPIYWRPLKSNKNISKTTQTGSKIVDALDENKKQKISEIPEDLPGFDASFTSRRKYFVSANADADHLKFSVNLNLRSELNFRQQGNALCSPADIKDKQKRLEDFFDDDNVSNGILSSRKRKHDTSKSDVLLSELISSFRKPGKDILQRYSEVDLDLDTEFQIINEVIEEDLARISGETTRTDTSPAHSDDESILGKLK